MVVSPGVCEAALHQTRLGPTYRLHPGMLCAGGQLGKDACKVCPETILLPSPWIQILFLCLLDLCIEFLFSLPPDRDI